MFYPGAGISFTHKLRHSNNQNNITIDYTIWWSNIYHFHSRISSKLHSSWDKERKYFITRSDLLKDSWNMRFRFIIPWLCWNYSLDRFYAKRPTPWRLCCQGHTCWQQQGWLHATKFLVYYLGIGVLSHHGYRVQLISVSPFTNSN